MKFICPVCGYDGLDGPPENFEICPACHTEFGYDDIARSREELRHIWYARGRPWSSPAMAAPKDWELRKYEQLRNIGMLEYGTPADTQSSPTGRVNLEAHATLVNLPSNAVTLRGRVVDIGRTAFKFLFGPEQAIT